MSAYHRTTDNCTPVVQLTLFDAVPPGKAGGTAGVPPLEKAPVVQRVPPPAVAKAHTPFALARSGGTPKPGAKRKAVQSTGRVAGGPACIGCSSYQSLYRDGYLYGKGTCKARDDLTVASNNSRACALYTFHGQQRR